MMEVKKWRMTTSAIEFLTGGTLKDMVRNYEKHLIEEAMRQSADLPQVAQKLGITRQNLNHKMKQYHLQMPAGK